MNWPLTYGEMTLWELAHRLCGRSPYRFPWLPLAADVKDRLRTLVHDIHTGELDTLLIYEKSSPEQDVPPEYFIRHHMCALWDITAGTRFPRKFLFFVIIDRIEFNSWCERRDYPIPEFWAISDQTGSLLIDHYDWEDGHTEIPEPEEAKETASPKLRPEQKAKQDCRKKAIELWKENPRILITHMANHDEILAIARQYTPQTRIKWLRGVAPPEVRNRRGRPKKEHNSIS